MWHQKYQQRCTEMSLLKRLCKYKGTRYVCAKLALSCQPLLYRCRQHCVDLNMCGCPHTIINRRCHVGYWNMNLHMLFYSLYLPGESKKKKNSSSHSDTAGVLLFVHSQLAHSCWYKRITRSWSCSVAILVFILCFATDPLSSQRKAHHP